MSSHLDTYELPPAAILTRQRRTGYLTQEEGAGGSRLIAVLRPFRIADAAADFLAPALGVRLVRFQKDTEEIGRQRRPDRKRPV